jgi:hypothetical protein
MNAYQEKSAKLPGEVRDYLNSIKAIELNLLVCRKNNLFDEDISRHTDLVVDLFFKEIELKNLVEKIKEFFDFSGDKARKLAADIAGIRLLVVDKWFNGEVSAFLKSLGVSALDYQKINEEQIAAVKKEKSEAAAEEAEARAEKERLMKEEIVAVKSEPAEEEIGELKIDWEKEKEEVIDIFKNDLAGMLFFQPSEGDFNDTLAYLLAENGESFSDELGKALLGNNEKLTEKPFSLSGRPVQPTIANWLSYFIKEKGSAKFDNIILTDFLVKSANAKGLSDEEKNAVKKLLLLYRNLKFFPESMPNETGEGWEIIPSAAEAGLTKAKTVGTPLTADYAAKAESLDAAEKEEEENKEAEEKIAALEKIAAAYPVGSFQRKAVEAEMKKVSKK